MDNTAKEPDQGACELTSKEDDWHNVTDAKKRKQIQDRLAQRNRRRRLREAKQGNEGMTLSGPSNQVSSEPETDVFHQQNHLIGTATDFDWLNSFYSVGNRPENVLIPPTHCRAVTTSSTRQSYTISYEIPYEQTIFSALYMNGEILGLICGILPRCSPPASLNVPASLHPTPTQLLNVHNTGYDRFPFPKMRDNAIIHQELIDDDEFFRDIFTMPSFSIKPGGAPWDPASWVIDKAFADKWGFLFY